MSTPTGDQARERPADPRAARRAFIRASHPDAGGDPDAFVAGLAAFERPGRPVAPDRRPAVVRSRRPDRVVVLALRRFRRRAAGLPPRTLQ